MKTKELDIEIYKEFSEIYTKVLHSLFDKSFDTEDDQNLAVVSQLKEELRKKDIQITKNILKAPLNYQSINVGTLKFQMNWLTYHSSPVGTSVYSVLDQYFIKVYPLSFGAESKIIYFQKDLLEKLINFK